MSNSKKRNCVDSLLNLSTGGMDVVQVPRGNSSGRGHLLRPSRMNKEPSVEEQQELRRKINNRERKRMQDLNVAMDALREVMVPYSAVHQHGYPGRKLSKISTLILARNYIVLLSSSLQEMRRMIGEINGPCPRLLVAGGWPFFTAPGSVLLTPDTIVASKCPIIAAEESQYPPLQWSSAGPICPCGICRLPRFIQASTSSRFLK
ncbi:oligodendrocyte transcription factor 1 [Erpetoichthys calabaricus]|uniref:oligodendrocyte transcription factor 1 n=1 Tax=Erpetoichthys calabaricus TaxID=27687 RepID=UPI0010A0B781|nr:oligodendrocyte transcription factor 1 [Erpetoichthys calabaricus]